MKRRPWFFPAAGVLVGVAITSAIVLHNAPDNPAAGPPPVKGSDPQWSGYIVHGVHHQAGATFRIPTIRCDAPTANLSIWVGLDGAGSRTVEQVGIETLCRDGKARYGAWTQAYPRPSKPLDWTLRPGDVVSAEARSLGNGTIRLSIAVSGSSNRSTHVEVPEPAGRAQSAEIIVEQSGNAPGPIPHFDLVTFSNATIDGRPLADARPSRIVMVDERNRPRAVPSTVHNDSFAVNQTR